MFDSSLLESRPDRRRSARGPRLGLPAAVALHAAVLAGVIGASIAAVEDPPDPVIGIQFFSAPPAPQPPRGDGGRSPLPPARAVSAAFPRSDASIAPPVDPIDPRHAEPDDAAPTRSADTGEAGTPGERDGVPFGIGNGPLGPGGGGAGDEPPLPIGGDVRPPELVRRVEPGYPDAARRAGLTGVVILEAIIAATGDVEDVRVLKSGGPLLDTPAASAVRQWRYRPATLNGRPVRVFLTVTVTYSLAR